MLVKKYTRPQGLGETLGGLQNFCYYIMGYLCMTTNLLITHWNLTHVSQALGTLVPFCIPSPHTPGFHELVDSPARNGQHFTSC